jgi:uncharacterized membrane protein YqgA involved in biofilm formation
LGGTILNAITVAIGGTLGLLVGHRLSERIQESVVTGLGLVTFFVGIDNAGHTGNVILPLLSIMIGVIIGELLQIDVALDRFAGWLQAKYAGSSSDKDNPSSEESADDHSARERFITGFVTASLVFCVGPLTVLGSVQDGMGLQSGFDQLAIKSVLDGFAAMAFAASFGVGVLFSIITVLGLQGGLAFIGSISGEFMTDPMINEMTAAGGLILLALSLTLLDLKKPRVANFLPALVIAPILVVLAKALFLALGIDTYPA